IRCWTGTPESRRSQNERNRAAIDSSRVCRGSRARGETPPRTWASSSRASQRLASAPAFVARSAAPFRRSPVGIGRGFWFLVSGFWCSIRCPPETGDQTPGTFSCLRQLFLQALGLEVGRDGLDQLVEVAVEDVLHAVRREADAVVGDPRLGEVVR